MGLLMNTHNLLPVPRAAAREAIGKLEASMLAMKDRHVEMPTKHYFAGGVYVREIYIPAGTCLTGKIHKTEHVNIIAKGKVWVFTEHTGREYFEAPHTYISPVGSKKALYVVEDVVWITCHKTDETDLDKLEEQFVAESYDDFNLFLEHKEDN